MSDFTAGYRKPPKNTQFVKGQSGNPNGRPKGSQNLATLLNKIARQRVQVTENGRSREITKFEAILVQLVNKALRGDVSAIHELRYWIQLLEDSVQAGPLSSVKHENDDAVMASIVERIRQSENLPSDNATNSAEVDPSEEEK